MKKSGFTLAEVLITLGIIGVVAAMTIPALINQTNNADIKAAVKKGLSALNQAVLMSVAIDGNDFSQLSSATATTLPGANGTFTGMFGQRMNVASSTYGSVTNLGGPFSNASNYVFFFNDGIAITFPKAAGSCASGSSTYTAGGACTLTIDVNGAKGPNQLSTATNSSTGLKDEFTFLFYNTSVLPATKAAQYILYN